MIQRILTIGSRVAKAPKSAGMVAAAFAAMLVTAGCMKDFQENDGGEPLDQGTPVTIAIAPSVDGMPAAGGTRGYHDPNELTGNAQGHQYDRKIYDLTVLLYNPTTGALVADGKKTFSNLGGDPAMLSLKTGLYDVVFIANAQLDRAGTFSYGPNLLAEFLATQTNYDQIGELQNALIDRAAYTEAMSAFGSRGIPMYGIVEDVEIVSHHKIAFNGSNTPVDTRTTPWSPVLTRTGVRLSLELEMEPWMFEEWGGSYKSIDVNSGPESANLLTGSGRDNHQVSAVRVYRIYPAANPSNPEPASIDRGYYFPVYGTNSEIVKYIVRLDRIIVPELFFADKRNSNKALEISFMLGGRQLEAKVCAPNPETSEWGYTLPRNTWIHLDAKIQNTTLELNPTVMDWNTITTGDLQMDGKYFLEVDRKEVVFLQGGGTQTLLVTTNHPGLTIPTVSETHLSVSCQPFTVLDGVTTTIPVTVKYSTTNVNNTINNIGSFAVSADKLKQTVRVKQMGIKNHGPVSEFTPYVGAFWKADQTGERLINMEIPSTWRGPWEATVVHGEDWIVLDKMMTDDPNVGWLPGADESRVDLGNDPGFDARYPVNSDKTHIEGTTDAQNTSIYFRIGLRSRYSPTHDRPARYGAIIVHFHRNTSEQFYQRIFVRQGEDADFLFRKSEFTAGHGRDSGYNLRFSPYNLSIPNDKSFDANGSVQLDLQGGAFTDYPTKAGAFFKHLSGVNPRYAYNPSISEFTSATWGASTHPGYWDPWTQETCPPGYRRPKTSASRGTNEIVQSLFLSTLSGSDVPNNTNTMVGFYADGYFDRLARSASYGTGLNGQTYYCVKPQNEGIAHLGTVFYNASYWQDYNYCASLFFPVTGYVDSNYKHTNMNAYAGYMASTISPVTATNSTGLWLGGLSATPAYSDGHNSWSANLADYTYGLPIRCVK